MAKNVLKIINPPINVQMMYSYHLTITLMNEKTYPWFYSNFIQLKAYPSDLITNNTNSIKFFQGKVDFNPWLNKHTTIDGNNMEIIRDLMESIDNKFYVECSLDEFYLSNLRMGGLNHYYHKVMVYGYDALDEIFYIVGYRKNQTYGETTCTFNELESAFYSDIPLNINHKEGIKRFCVPDIKYKPGVDIERIVLLMNDYINGINSLGAEKKSDEVENIPTYGVDVYRFLQNSLKLLLNGIGKVDIRGYHALMEHKKVMSQRLKFLESKNYLIESAELIRDYYNIEKSTEKLRSLAIMYTIKKSEATLKAMIEYLLHIEKQEISLLKEIKVRLERNLI
ncbi:hypothetical protein [Paenibacillus mesotrionivorans]|jgi:hypothetical protein|uniref:Uncharacterized protein n=1 Tax=Paenibacillus mesotrionivorans TaxID=3160968 RepID=A0ACC7NVN2_9BACL